VYTVQKKWRLAIHVTVHETSALTALRGQCRNYPVLSAFNHRYSYIQSSVTFRKQPISIIFIARGFSKSETSRESGTEFRTWACLTESRRAVQYPFLSYATHFWATAQFCELRRTTFELHIRRWSYATAWTTVHSIELRHILSNYAALFRATAYYYELRRTLLSYATPFRDTPNYSWLSWGTHLSHTAPFWVI
jgi:hypothetical protein